MAITKTKIPNKLGVKLDAIIDSINAGDLTGAAGAPGAGAPVGVPATATAAGTAGQWSYDATHIYVCKSTNSWVRATLAAW